ncbi:phenazine biosynthesis protein PhzF family [Pseudarcicella hirudinis]|uniref:Phenazine biosynthesis protein PhzF family n=1 Tax=Pseudarcicella hirudinis TaxID=1079859 RepID=A0A1I5NQI2_9BACT|nr:PhzF family phenazine biosynthesis protein [Pseudarcicella hirudinis]SFP24078.1 phenazine biosynthesis protein PhzF family [Pseudarcicella hirudinis]
MKLTIYQLDAFTDRVFGGNPAAIVPLNEWIPEELMQKIAAENNLAETAFYVKDGERFHIRWFTPTVEVDLCGHATLAASYVIYNFGNFTEEIIEFTSRSGILKVSQKGDLLELDFPADKLEPVATPEAFIQGLGQTPLETYKGSTDYLLVFDSESTVRSLKPDFRTIAQVVCRGIIVTSPGENVDFVSRFFGPQSGIDEDPVTGSAHTSLTPLWSEKLGKTALTAKQVSPREGTLWCELAGNRVKIAGNVAPYLVGEIDV